MELRGLDQCLAGDKALTLIRHEIATQSLCTISREDLAPSELIWGNRLPAREGSYKMKIEKLKSLTQALNWERGRPARNECEARKFLQT